MDDLEATVHAALTRLAGDARLLVALSGGADSVALLHLARAGGFDVTAAHLDHAARPDSAADAAWVAARCRDWGVTLITDRIAVPPGPGFEARAREVRLAWLAGLGFPMVATGHHMEDQAETVLFRLARGTGAAQAGMREARPLAPGVTLIRPLLGVPRAALRAWLAARGLGWREDPTNADPAFARNRIRHEILPALTGVQPGVVRSLARFAAIHMEEGQEPNASMANLSMAVVAPGIGEIDRGAFNMLPVGRRRQLLRLLASRMGALPPESAGLERGLQAAWAGGSAHLGRGWRLDTDASWIALMREAEGPAPRPPAATGEQPTAPWGWRVVSRDVDRRDDREGPCLVRFAAGSLPPDLVWRSADPDGDRFRPWGHREGTLRRWLTRQGIPRHRQASLLVLASAETVVWIPGYGRSGLAPLAEDTLNGVEMRAGAGFPV